MRAGTIYKLMTRAEWETAQAAGAYYGSAGDKRDGFIHFSKAAQLAGTARKYFSGVPDLVLLAVDTKALISPPSPLPSPQGETGQQRSFSQPCPLADMSTFDGKHAASAPWRAGNSKIARGQECAHASVQGEGQDEGVLLRWEPSRGGDLFPHLYAPLPVCAVKSITAISLATDGTPIIPRELEP